MLKVLKFKVEIKGLEDKIWRIIEIPEDRTIADLAYTILASFNSLAYHLYNIKYKNYIFDCWICPEDNIDFDVLSNATKINLGDLDLIEKDNMEMEYDYGSTVEFTITYLGSKDVDYLNAYLYPLVTDGAGQGMLDDVSGYELEKIVEDTDKAGVSNYYYSPGYQKRGKFDYRKFSLSGNNKNLKGQILAIKNGYENIKRDE